MQVSFVWKQCFQHISNSWRLIQMKSAKTSQRNIFLGKRHWSFLSLAIDVVTSILSFSSFWVAVWVCVLWAGQCMFNNTPAPAPPPPKLVTIWPAGLAPPVAVCICLQPPPVYCLHWNFCLNFSKIFHCCYSTANNSYLLNNFQQSFKLHPSFVSWT